MPYTDDPIRDFYANEARLEKQLQRLPVCCECGEPIQEDWLYVINDEPVCEDCLQINHQTHVEDFIL